MFKKFNIFILMMLIVGQTIIGPIGSVGADKVDPQDDPNASEQTGEDEGFDLLDGLTIENEESNNEEDSEIIVEKKDPETDGEKGDKANPKRAGPDKTLETEEPTIKTMGAITPMSGGTYPDMDLSDVTLNTEFKVGNEVIDGTSATVKNGDTANFTFTLADITGNHNYGPGTKLEVEIPSIFNNVPGSGTIGEIGTYSVSGNKVTVEFNKEIRSWGPNEEDLGPLPIENVKFFVQAQFNYTGTDLNTSVAIPGGETITLNFTPKNGKPIEKNRVGNFTQHNADSIEWKVVVNTDLSSANDFVDTLQGGHKFKPSEGPTVKEINLGPNGGPTDYTIVATVNNPNVTYNDNDNATVMTITGLAANKAYEITYKTYPDDPKNATSVDYSNKATYGQGNSDSDSARITYDAPLKKTAGSASTSDLTTEWTIKVNHNERDLTGITVTDTWLTTGGSGDQKQEIVDGINGITVKKGNNDVTQDFINNNRISYNDGDQGFSVDFGDITEAYTITYKTKPTADTYITSNMTVNNNVTRSDDENTFKSNASVTYNKTSFMLNKTAEGVNYADKTMKWKIVANQAGKTLANGTVFEDRFTPNNNQQLKDGTLTVKDSDDNIVQHTVNSLDNPKHGFNITLGQEVTGPITIEYETNYDIKDVGSNERSYHNDVTITEHQIPNMGELTDGATQSVKGEQTANGKKTGHYDYADKKFVWEVDVNFNYNSFTNAIFEDEIDNEPAQKIENIKVFKGELDASGNFINPVEVTGVSNNANESNKIKLALGNINQPYKITYESYVKDDVIPETPGKLEVENKATLTEDGQTDPNASWTAKVGVNYTDQLIKKGFKQQGNTAGIDWNFEFNYAQSNLSNIVITDTVGKDSEGNPNQLIKEDSFKVYTVAMSGTSNNSGYNATGTKTEVSNYTLDVDVTNGTFTLTLPDGDSAYYIEYETIFLGNSEDTLENEVEVSYYTTEKENTGDSFSQSNFTFGGSGSTTKVPFVIVKTDAATGELLNDVEFDLYRDGITNPILNGKTENGVLDFGIMLGEGDYTLKEKDYNGYDDPGDIKFTLKKSEIATSGSHEGKFVVNVENIPTGTPMCTDFTLTVKDANGDPRENVKVKYVNKVTGKEVDVPGQTSDKGEISIPRGDLPAGSYNVYEVDGTDETILGEVEVKYDGDCKAQVQPKVCDNFTITVEDKDGNPRQNIDVTVTVKGDKDTIVAEGTTDSDGKIVIDREKLPNAGTYDVFEDGIYLGEVEVDYNKGCEANVDPTVSGVNTCPKFTITVKDRSDNPRENVKVVVKDPNGDLVEGGTDANGDPITEFTTNTDGQITLPYVIEKGTYTVYEVNDNGTETRINSFTVTTGCEAEVKPSSGGGGWVPPTCNDFTITVKQDGKAVESGVQLTLKSGSTEKTITTNSSGQVVIDKLDLPEGSYTVYDKDGKEIGSITVTYNQGECNAEINITAPKVCEDFTVTVKVDGEPVTSGSYTFTSNDGNTVVTKTVDSTSKIVFDRNELPEGSYTVEDEEKRTSSITVTYETDPCGTEVNFVTTEDPEDPTDPEDPNDPKDPSDPGKPGKPGKPNDEDDSDLLGKGGSKDPNAPGGSGDGGLDVSIKGGSDAKGVAGGAGGVDGTGDGNLPKTSTNFYTIGLVGLLFVIVGTIILAVRRKRVS